MDNQLADTKKEVLRQWIGLVGLAVLLVILFIFLGVKQFQVSDPYSKNVLSLQGDPVQGQAIFQMNCAGCHAWLKDSQVGPSLEGISQRKSDVGIINQVVSGQTPPMPQFQPNEQEMADLLSYLKQM
ncbi:MAG: cytochrome c [Okeania sp. SIO3I5]|uniref:c-type cytochrome n=1 Tax=Okeania sp. SIO3I5 TaxID=2607805 RepID=UPI0013B8E930|nr:cytochrome c [Okeania sp. SIO3I5]NEQ36603.1 cytochrome c [Okeania sp. SIO3I5]